MHARGFSIPAPRDPNFVPPKTKAEFEALGYAQRVQLLETYPEVYATFTAPEKRSW